MRLTKLTRQRDRLHERKYTELFKNFPQVPEDLVNGEHLSHPTVYKILDSYLSQGSSRNLTKNARDFKGIEANCDWLEN